MSAKTHYLTANDLFDINAEVTGMLPFVRDRFLLQSAAKRPMISLFGQPQFPTLHEKAAVLLESLAYHHLFADGNKRTALKALLLFLDRNGWQPIWTDNEEYAFILEVAQGKQTLESIAKWLRAHTEERGE